jgi:hypothetical protein
VNFLLDNDTVRSNELASTTCLPPSLDSLQVMGRIRTPTLTCEDDGAAAICFDWFTDGTFTYCKNDTLNWVHQDT